LIFSKKEMVLPDRIELSTSPLPMDGLEVRSACGTRVFCILKSRPRIFHGRCKLLKYMRFLGKMERSKVKVSVPQRFLL
jgi:hypothetical protein